jgi:hypothetical protein
VALSASSTTEGAKPVVTVAVRIVAMAADRGCLRYDRNGDEHYDVIQRRSSSRSAV